MDQYKCPYVIPYFHYYDISPQKLYRVQKYLDVIIDKPIEENLGLKSLIIYSYYSLRTEFKKGKEPRTQVPRKVSMSEDDLEGFPTIRLIIS